MAARRTVVMKFGGTSIVDADALGRVTDIVATRPGRRAVVVSALAGVTDALVAIASAAAAADRERVARDLASLEARHHRMAGALVRDHARLAALGRIVSDTCAGVAATCGSVTARGEITPADHDAILAAGEGLSSHIAAESFRAAGINAVWVDARAVIVTDARHTSASPLTDATRRRAAALVGSALDEGRVPVLGGFVGATADGATTTLGRGGSDYSAAILAAALHADQVEIWTDVDGVFTADPRIVLGARQIERLSFAQAFELALFGAKVLHPRTVQPACEGGIPIRILNTWAPLGTGTLITSDPDHAASVIGIACRRDIVVLEITPRESAARAGFVGTLLGTVERCGLEPLTVDGSAERVRLIAPAVGCGDAAMSALEGEGTVVRREGLAVVSAFGSALARAETARRLLAECGNSGVSPFSILQPDGGPALALLVPAGAATDVMRRLHALLFERSVDAAPASRTEAHA